MIGRTLQLGATTETKPDTRTLRQVIRDLARYWFPPWPTERDIRRWAREGFRGELRR